MTLPRFLPMLLVLLLVPILRAQVEDDPKKKKGAPDGLKALKHPEANVRYGAAQTLADLGPLAKFAVPELREALKDKNGYVRVKVVEALWRIDPTTPTTELLPILLQALKDKNAGVRAAAPPVLALFGPKAKLALPAMVAALGDKEFDVKMSVVAALGDLGPVAKDSAHNLLDLTKDKDFNLLEPFVGAALANLGPTTLPTLIKALADKSPDKRRVSAYALGSMGKSAAPAADALAKALNDDEAATRKLAARALGKIGPDAQTTLPQLENALADKDVAVRIESALATWFITGKAQHVGVLVKALSDKSTNVKDAACQALATMKAGAKDAAQPVANLLDDKELRLRAVITLGEIGSSAAKASEAKLTKLLADKDGEIQLWSAFALWQISGDAKRSLKVLNATLATELHYTQSIIQLGEMGEAAQPLLQTLVNLYRIEDVPVDRLALRNAIKKIDPSVAMKLGIK